MSLYLEYFVSDLLFIEGIYRVVWEEKNLVYLLPLFPHYSD